MNVKTQESIIALDIEMLILHELIGALISTHPDSGQILATFQRGIESLAQNAPDGTDPERIVELRARAAQHVIALRRQIASSALR